MAFEAVLFGLVAALTWGFGDFYAAKVSQRFGGITTAFFISFMCAVLFAVICALFFRDSFFFDGTAMAYAIGGGAVFTLGAACFFKGLELGPVSIVSPLGSTYPLIATAMLVLFGATLSTLQMFGIVLVVCGIVLAAGLLDAKFRARRIGTGPLLGILAALFWGAGIGLYSQSIEIVGWQQTSLVQLATVVLVMLPLLPFIRGKERVFAKVQKTLSSPILIGTSTLQLAGLLAVNMGIGVLIKYAAIVVAVSALYPVLTVFLALRHMNEKISRPALAGAFTAVLGVAALSLG